MPTIVERNAIEALPGFRSREVSLFLAQMDDQSRRLTADTRGLTAADLEWQPRAGTNTIGMLLAHIAIVEVWWTELMRVDRAEASDRITRLLGILDEDDGIPLPADGHPPRALSGKELPWFDDLLAKARANAKSALAGLEDPELERAVPRKRANGDPVEFTPRWILYHMLEHLAGHYGQILLLRHLLRERQAAS